MVFSNNLFRLKVKFSIANNELSILISGWKGLCMGAEKISINYGFLTSHPI